MGLIKNILEIAYYLSGMGLLVVGYFGLKQVKIGLQQLEVSKVKSMRDAAMLSAKQLDYFADNLIPKYLEVEKVHLKRNIKIYDGSVECFSEDERDVKEYNEKFFEELKKKPIARNSFNSIKSDIITICNRLESLSSYFTQGIADEKVAYDSIGETYCNLVKKMYPHICNMIGSEDNEKSFPNLRKLYFIWNKRLKEEKLEFEKQELSMEPDRELSTIDSKMG